MARKKPGRQPGYRAVIPKNPMEMSVPLPETIENPEIVVAPGEFYCICCGKTYAKQKGNFYRSLSPLHRGNNKYLPICNSCVNNLFGQYTEILGSEEEAIHRLCQKFDIYYSETILKKSEVPRVGQSTRMSEYIKICNASNIAAGRTYDTYLKEMKETRVVSQPDTEDNDIPDGCIDIFGMGFSVPEYQRMKKQYDKTLENYDGDGDPNFLELAKTLCTTQIFMDRSIEKNDLDSYDKSAKLHQATLKAMQWKPDKPKTDAAEETFTTIGQMRAMIEQYCPSEIYKDKNLYKDVDDIESYWKRFIVRPFKNFFTGSSEQDPEFSVGETEE